MSLKSLLKQSKLTYTAASLLRRAPYPLIRAILRLSHALRGVDQDKVYFSSFSGKLYNENPKYVCEALHKIRPDAKLVFRLNREGMRQAELPDYVKPVPQYSPRAFYHMATARVIVKNARFKPYMMKFADQVYVQLWHGDRGFKKIIFDLEPGATKKYIDWKYMDIGVCGSDFGSRVYMRSAFGFKGELLKCGYPKNDLLIANPPELAERVRRRLSLPENTRFMLYAPTFRDQNIGSASPANFSLKKVREALERGSGEKWMMLTRGHTLNSGVAADEGMDVSHYPDVSELLLACDALITDYSSIAGDFLLLNRPIYIYHADRSQYTQKDRTLVFDPEQSPFHIAHSEAELLEMVSRPFDAVENCRELAAFYGVCESGHAAEQVAERISICIKSK